MGFVLATILSYLFVSIKGCYRVNIYRAGTRGVSKSPAFLLFVSIKGCYRVNICRAGTRGVSKPPAFLFLSTSSPT